MKHCLWICFLLAMLVNGCTQEEMLRNSTSVSGEGRTFTTSFENDESRTYLEDGLYSRWTEGDRISLFDASTLNSQYLFAGDTGDSGGTFFRLSKPEGTGNSLAANYAVYPYDKDMTISADGVITLNLPSNQHYAENSYGLGDNTMVAVTEDADDTFLQFKNVGGSFKLQLYGDDVTVKSITLMGNNGEKIAGKATLAPAYGKAPVVAMADDATTSITLDCGEKGVKIGASAEEATTFWVVVPPTTFDKGITITVKDMNGKVFTQTTDKQLSIERNVVKPMAAVKVKPGNINMAYSEDETELEGWSAGLFAGEGTYIMGKPHGDNGYLMTIGNMLKKESAIVYIDESGQMREIFIDNTIITFGDNVNGNVDVSIIERGGIEKMEQITLSGYNLQSRSSNDHSQQTGILNLLMNLEGMYGAVSEIADAKNFSKKGVIMFLANKADFIRNAIVSLGGPDIFNDTFSNLLSYGMNFVGLAELIVGTANPVSACILSYASLYTTYLDLFDDHIEVYFGSSVASIEGIEFVNSTLDIDLHVSGYEPWYDVECGVIVQKNSFPAPRYSNGLSTKTVTQNGIYAFSENAQMAEVYYCRPFLIHKSKASLWKGFIGDMVGPLVRYGKTVKYSTPYPAGQLLSIENVKRNSAVVKCQFSNAESGVECGIIISNNEGYNQKQTVSNTEGEQSVTISGLNPFTEYTCTPYVKLTKSEGGVYYKEGNSITFKTLPPDISGTWNCKQEYYKTTTSTNPSFKNYSLTLNEDGTASCSEYENSISGSWSFNTNGVLSIKIMRSATTTYNSGITWEGQVNDIKTPTMFTGYVHGWTYNQYGYHSGDGNKFTLTK